MTQSKSRRSRPLFAVSTLMLALPGLAGAAETAPASGGLELAGIPVDFFLFGMTLLGVALFHH